MKRKRILMVISVVLILVFSSISGVQAHAAQSYMGDMKRLKWDLKPGKKYKVNLMTAGIGLKPYTLQMTGYSLSGPDADGIMTLIYTIRFSPRWKPTKTEVHKIVNSRACRINDITDGYCMNLQPDYYTGYDLENWANSPVEMELGEWRETNKKYYYGKNTREWYYTSVLMQTTRIYFPYYYDGLCIVLGTSHILGQTYADELYLDGKAKFGLTSYYNKSWKSFHAMRVR